MSYDGDIIFPQARYDGEAILTLARLLQWHFPWQGDELFLPDYRDVNDYLMDMSLAFERDHVGTDWEEVDYLRTINDYLLAYVKKHPMTWTTQEAT